MWRTATFPQLERERIERVRSPLGAEEVGQEAPSGPCTGRRFAAPGQSNKIPITLHLQVLQEKVWDQEKRPEKYVVNTLACCIG